MKKVTLFIAAIILLAGTVQAEEVDQSMLNDCVKTAEILNKSGKVNINTNELTPLYTWRASCAENPPTGQIGRAHV